MNRLKKFCIVTLIGWFSLSPTSEAAEISLPNGVKVEIPDGATPEMRKEIMKAAMKQGGGGPPKEEQGGEEKKEDKKDENKKEKDDKKKEEKKSDSVTRPDKPEKDPDPAELEAMPKDGKLVLQFLGHPWQDMIKWYSRATGREIEWQKLPSGYVNLRTQRAFTLEETGDLLNRLLLSRGYTMLDDGEFIQVLQTEGMNPAFVPRIEPRQLATKQPHSFVRVSFPLQRMKAEELAKELEAMKSKHGKLVPMSAANRIEAMDTVRNLRDIYAAIDAEQSSGNRAPREFEIQFLRAELVKKKLDEMFAKPKATAMTPEQIQQMQQQQQQRRNRGGNQQGQKPPGAGGGNSEISIVVNEFRNSIIVKAAPNVMVDIAAAVELLDVQSSRNNLDIKAYTLATRSPTEVAEILKESGALSPTSIVRVDKQTKALLVSGSALDHLRIEELIKTIDGSARRFERIRLRRYPAAQVATTIENMMGKPKEEKKNRRYYGYWDYQDNDDEANPNDVFKVTADVENNNLILKCNDAEYELVIDLLTQMGEVMTRSKFASNEIVLDVNTEDDLLERVRDIFNSTSENQVVLPPPILKVEESNDEDAEDESEEKDADDETQRTREVRAPVKPLLEQQLGSLIEFAGEHTPPAKVVVGEQYTDIIPRTSSYRTLLTQADPAQTSTAQAESEPKSTPQMVRRNQRERAAPPIIIRRNAQGKLVIRCDDPAALEKFEDLLRQMAPPTQDWVHFRLKHVTASWMRLQLKDFFDEDDEQQNLFVWDYWGGNDKEDPPPGLGDQRKMRFIDDGESTLVVRNASAKQLATVKDLIALYDVAEPPNEQNGRFKEIIRIKHSKARVIETAIKDALRDLLSSNDKAFAQQEGNGGDGEGRGRRMGPFSFTESSPSVLQGTSFKGKISFGVDETTNSLIVTAEGMDLLRLVVDMVHDLDVAAVTQDDTRVVTVPASLSSGSLRETLTKMFGVESVTVKPADNQGGQEGQEGENGQPGGKGRGERKGRGN